MEGSSAAAGEKLLPSEAEAFVSELRTFQVKQIGSDKWMRQRERLERLHLQAYSNVLQNSDEFIKDFIISYNKLPLLVHELLVVEVWRDKIFPLMMQICKAPTSSFITYIVLYFESVLAGLLELALYYREMCEVEDRECLVDLLDYCHRRIIAVLSEEGEERGGDEGDGEEEGEEKGGEEERSDEEETENPKVDLLKELTGHCKSFQFARGMSSLSIVKYITDHLSVLPLSITTRLLNTHDTPCLLVNLMQKKPWIRKNEKGDKERYDDRWVPVETSERLKISKVEGQVWLALYQLLLGEPCQQKYEFTDHNKSILLKLRAYLTEPILDQIPALADLQRYLEHLSIMEPPPGKRQLILEQVPAIRDEILRTNRDQWDAIATRHVSLMLEPDIQRVQELAKGWVSTFGEEFLEPSTCAVCGREAMKRCSKCRVEWYCSRDCQVKDWKRHKPICQELNKSHSN